MGCVVFATAYIVSAIYVGCFNLNSFLKLIVSICFGVTGYLQLKAMKILQ